MAGVRDVAGYILEKHGPMTAMKLQKLCYYSYGYHLAWEGRRLFQESFQAWANGPVCRPLYDLHRGRLQLRAGEIPGKPDALDEGERESIDLVLDAYGPMSAHQLSLLTHQELPWEAARARANAAPLERSTEPLRDDEILEYFDALTSTSSDESQD